MQSAASPRVSASGAAAPAPSLPAGGEPVVSSVPTYAVVTVPATVVKRFGEARAQAGYRMVAELTTALSFQPDLVGKRAGFTAADFAPGRERLTSGMRAQWDAKVKRALGGDVEAKGVVHALAFYDIEPEMVFPADDTLVIRQSVSAPSLAVDGQGTLRG